VDAPWIHFCAQLADIFDLHASWSPPTHCPCIVPKWDLERRAYESDARLLYRLHRRAVAAHADHCHNIQITRLLRLACPMAGCGMPSTGKAQLNAACPAGQQRRCGRAITAAGQRRCGRAITAAGQRRCGRAITVVGRPTDKPCLANNCKLHDPSMPNV